MSFHLRQINKLPKPKDLIKETKEKSSIDNLSSKRLINSKTNLIDLIIDQNEKIKIKNYLREYLEQIIHIDQLIKYLLQILNQQNQQNRVNTIFITNFSKKSFFLFKNEIIESIRKFVRPNDLDRFDIYILKDDLNTLKVSLFI